MTETQIPFKKLGSHGAEILMLHGWQHSLANLYDLAKFLAKDYQVYLLDLPGFGKSPLLHEDASTSDYVEYLKKFLAEQNIKPIIIGHSFGGRLAVKLAALYPEVIADKLILIGTPGFPQRKTIFQTARIFTLKYFSKAIKLIDRLIRSDYFNKYFVPKFGSSDYQRAGQLRKLLVKTVNENLSEYAEKIKLKTLLLWGKQDQQASLEQANAYHKAIPHSELRVLAHHGHEPFADVGAHYTAKIIREFLAK